MPVLSFVNHISSDVELDHSRITDLDIAEVSGTSYLLSSTRYDGVLESWQISAGTLSKIDTLNFLGCDVAGGRATPAPLAIAGSAGILSGGGSSDNLQTIQLNANGTFGTAITLSALPAQMASFQQGVTVSFGDGTQAVYGAVVGQAGLARVSFDSLGAFTGNQTILETELNEISVLATDQDFLFAANPDANAITSWQIANDGSLTAAGILGVSEGLAINAPSAMQVTEVGGLRYLILGSAGSNSISVMEVGNDGSLTLRDHILDGLTARFAGITSLDVVTHSGRTYVIAGGSDDGVSTFLLLEGGRLLPQAHIADTTTMGLDNVSAIAARGRGSGIDLFVASGSEIGLTQLRLDTGPNGIIQTAALAGGLLAGTVSNDILQGHDGDDLINGLAGDDILRDGAGSDTLTGGAGEDVFLMSRDGETDIITDFTLGEDKLDLSLWPLLRDISQITFSLRGYGMDLQYGDEQLIVYSSDGSYIDYRLLTNDDIIGAGGSVLQLNQDTLAPRHRHQIQPSNRQTLHLKARVCL